MTQKIMKSPSKLIILIITLVALGASAYAQSPREQFQTAAAAQRAEREKARVKTAADKKVADRLRPTVEGKWSSGVVEFQVVRTGERFTLTSVIVLGQQAYAKNVVIDKQHIRFTSVYSSQSSHDLILSESGNELIGRSGTNESARFTRNP
jgi:hypothetical protein